MSTNLCFPQKSTASTRRMSTPAPLKYVDFLYAEVPNPILSQPIDFKNFPAELAQIEQAIKQCTCREQRYLCEG